MSLGSTAATHLQDAGRKQGLVGGMRDIGVPSVNPDMVVPLPQG